MTKEELIIQIFPRFHRLMNKFDEIKNQKYFYNSKEALFPGEIHTLTAIADKPGSTISEIGLIMGITKSAASQFIIKLEKKGMLEKNKLPENKKNIVINLSTEGRDVVTKFRSYWNGLFSSAFDQLSLIDRESLENMLKTFDLIEESMDKQLDT